MLSQHVAVDADAEVAHLADDVHLDVGREPREARRVRPREHGLPVRVDEGDVPDLDRALEEFEVQELQDAEDDALY